MRTKKIKLMVIFILITTIVMATNSSVFAIKDPAEILISERIPGDTDLKTLGENVLGVTTVIGYAMAIIIAISIGIKYMVGTVEEKAGYKKSMIPYFVGCVILVAAPTLTNVIYDASQPLKVTAVIKAKYCEECMDIGANCSNPKKHYMSDIYYCTGCDKPCSRTCPICGETYQE